jgi:YfiH family protein
MLLPQIFDDSVIAAQSRRMGGVSPAPYSSLNLGLSVGDQESNVISNRELFFGGLGISLNSIAKSHQVHGSEVLVADRPGDYSGFDALITNEKGIFLAVSVADCVPILIHDPVSGCVAAVHAGWRGTAAEILVKTLRAMRSEYGAYAGNCRAFIGAAISFRMFEVGEEVAKHFSAQHKRPDPITGKWFVDLKEANRSQLLDAGLLPGNIEVSDACTVCDNQFYFSHRADGGITGRMMAVIGLQSNGI